MKYLVVIILTLSHTFCIAQVKKPNIIFILADDLGIDGVSSYGADLYKTPAIDKLAKQGIRYTRAYALPLCGPSRAMILTGRYPFRTGAVNQDQTGAFTPAMEVMMPKILKTAGYTSSMIGKWGQLPQGPAEFGFDDHLRFFGSGIYSTDQQKNDRYFVNGKESVLRKGEYMPDLMHRHLVDFLSDHKKDPFYVYYSLSHVHGEIIATPDTKPGTTEYNDLYVDNIHYMDKLVGKLIDVLDSLKLRENTLIVFFGDNGTAGKAASIGTVNGKKIVGKKGSLQEGGSLVPLIVNWPAVIRQPQVSSNLIDAPDFVPTFAALAGASLPAQVKIDGRSFAYQLKGGKGEARSWIFNELGKDWYVRDANWKLNRAGQLFDMRNAPFEENPAVVNEESNRAKDRLQAILNELNPAGGILDTGDGSGRHASKKKSNTE